MKNKATLIFLCGKMGAGKTTKSRQLAKEHNAVLLSEDEWLSTLYPQQINTFDDYLDLSRRLKPLIKSHVQNILSTNTNVVMDFPANTRQQRQWFKTLAEEVDAKPMLVYLDISNEQCLKQIAQRRIEQPERAQFDTEAVFHQVTKYFEAPESDEGLKLHSSSTSDTFQPHHE